MTRLCRCRSVSRASQDRRRYRTPELAGSMERRAWSKSQSPSFGVPIRAPCSYLLAWCAHRETVEQIRHCLRCRFSEPACAHSGCGHPAPMAEVPLQTEHSVEAVEHQQHAIVCASTLLSSNFFLNHILCCSHSCKEARALFRAAFKSSRMDEFSRRLTALSYARLAA